jgi:ubiquinone/menaquinone biosynthesis C-methylase UbiE
MARLTLLDIAPQMRERARERFADHRDRVSFMIADIEAPPSTAAIMLLSPRLLSTI